MSKTEKQFNKTVIAMWETKTGNALSMKIDGRSLEQVHKALGELEIGSKLILKRLSEEARSKFPNPDNAPHFFLEIITKDSVNSFESSNPRVRSERTI